VTDPLRTRAQVEALTVRPAAETLPFVAEAARILRRELDGRTPLIGFCGAPFTLAAYLVEGQGKEGFGAVKTMLHGEPDTLERLLTKLAASMADYLALQIQSGAQAVQIFDSWAGILGLDDYLRFAQPFVRSIVQAIRPLGVPVIYFVNAAPHLLEAAAATGADVLGICWRTPLDEAARRVGPHVALQGNLDPHVLFADQATVRRQVEGVLVRMTDRPGHIMNVGHGILPDTPIPAVETLISAVHGFRPTSVPGVAVSCTA
jgi:uroporphyrinogen decarboxylase